MHLDVLFRGVVVEVLQGVDAPVAVTVVKLLFVRDTEVVIHSKKAK